MQSLIMLSVFYEGKEKSSDAQSELYERCIGTSWAQLHKNGKSRMFTEQKFKTSFKYFFAVLYLLQMNTSR